MQQLSKTTFSLDLFKIFLRCSFSWKRNGAKLQKQKFNNIYYSLLPQQKMSKAREQKLSLKKLFFVFFSFSLSLALSLSLSLSVSFLLSSFSPSFFFLKVVQQCNNTTSCEIKKREKVETRKSLNQEVTKRHVDKHPSWNSLM